MYALKVSAHRKGHRGKSPCDITPGANLRSMRIGHFGKSAGCRIKAAERGTNPGRGRTEQMTEIVKLALKGGMHRRRALDLWRKWWRRGF
ncbi:hypothetical protein C8D95_103341 [Silicimonas algicola]|uniref:Uncharacterized protein n=1 Tax=Silicimonas algicola TaxID=1826607 RepID=A0A316G951_9RHOB|nr:hypothetical protein C8D95_103341 [Silicimonas algicola]